MLLVLLVIVSQTNIAYALENPSGKDEETDDLSYYFIYYEGGEQEIVINENIQLLLTGWTDESKTSVKGKIVNQKDSSKTINEVVLDVTDELKGITFMENEGFQYRLVASDSFKAEEVKPQELNNQTTVVTENENGTSIEEVKTIDENDTIIKQELVYYSTDENGQKKDITKEEYDTLNSDEDKQDQVKDAQKDKGSSKDSSTAKKENPDVAKERSLKKAAGNSASITYSTHVQSKGWMDYVADGEKSGTTGKKKRIEAIKIDLNNTPYKGGITYSSHVQSKGWMQSKSNDAISGTTGESKRMEAIKINLTGEMAKHYDVYYRGHVQDFGWLDWAKNGQAAGTEGLSKRMEAIEVVLVEKGEKAPGSTTKPLLTKPSVVYSTHVQSKGWMDFVADGKKGGTTGQKKRIEAIKVDLKDAPYSGGITYSAHVQDKGWMKSKSNGDIAGTTGQKKRMEAIKINLTGEMAKHYDVYYRGHVQDFGWLDWAKNGQAAGTEGLSKRMEAIEVVLVEKGEKAPGSTTKPLLTKPSVVYSTHVQSKGWMDFVADGKKGGTTGQKKRIEAIKVDLKDAPYSGGITYSAHVQNKGWMKSKSNGDIAGTTGQSKRMEAIKINLTGEMAKHYDVYYRGHVQDFGWLGWAKNGMKAGSEGLSKRVEAIEIKLVSKGKGESVSQGDAFKKATNNLVVTAIELPVYRSFEELSDYHIHLNPNYERYDTLKYGDTVYKIKEQQYATQIKTTDGKIGWVHTKDLANKLTDNLWLVKDTRNFRTSPGTSGENIGTIDNGTGVYVLGYSELLDPNYKKWYQIQTTSGEKGWIWGGLFSDDENSGYNLIRYEFDKKDKVTNSITPFTPLDTKSSVTANQINKFIDYKTGGQNTSMTGMGDAYLSAQKESGLNAIYLLAHSALESDWGRSSIVNKKYNYYGIGAIDSQPAQGAYTFDSQKGGIVAGAIWINKNYVNRELYASSYPYSQPTINNMRFDGSWHQYSTDEAWVSKIVNIANEFSGFIN
ncbi:glucosaminidase domain-containing protein [Lentibacillus songyuanensis]|uniref:glucosaminidase domain-containing protein n=1 Tax=Lentibacillus songyuanensis TaxID=3136161 RepID=UPI0031BAA2BE